MIQHPYEGSPDLGKSHFSTCECGRYPRRHLRRAQKLGIEFIPDPGTCGFVEQAIGEYILEAMAEDMDA
jgi:hypothetical protein